MAAVLSFIVSFLMMGTAFLHLLICLLIILCAIVFMVYAILRQTNWFAFDDENKMIVKAFRKRIPYDKIQSIVIAETPGGFCVNVKTGWMPPSPIISGLNRDDAGLAEKEFRQRFSSDITRTKSYSKKKFAIFMIFGPLIIISVFANFLYQMYRLQPSTPITYEKKAWFAASSHQEGTYYQIGGIGFRLPASFVQVRQDRDRLCFEDNANKIKISVTPDLIQADDTEYISILSFLTGIQSEYDLFRLAYTARYGVIPLLASSSIFKELSETTLCEINRNELHGMVLQGIRANTSIAEIIVSDKENGIGFCLSQPAELGKIKEALLQSVVVSIQSEIRDGK